MSSDCNSQKIYAQKNAWNDMPGRAVVMQRMRCFQQGQHRWAVLPNDATSLQHSSLHLLHTLAEELTNAMSVMPVSTTCPSNSLTASK